MKQETMGFWDGSGVRWTICKQSAPCSRQITHTNTSSPNFLLNALPDNQQCQSTEGNEGRKNGKWLNKVHFKMAMTLEVV